MAITKLHSFEADAEVLGRIHMVHFQDEELTIIGLSLEDAHRVLDALSLGSLVAVAVPHGEQAERYTPMPHRNGNVHHEEPHPAVMAGAPLPEIVTTPAPVEQVEAEFADASMPAGPSAKLPEDDDPFGPAPDPLPTWAGGTAPNPPLVPPTSRAPAPAGEAGDLPDELSKAKTVVGALHALALLKGCHEIEVLIVEATKLKDQVPALRVVVNLEDRIRRTVEAHPEKVWPA
jgi:hypothetical protein